MEQNTPRPIRCKAAVCKAPGQPLEMEEVEVAPPRAHEVRVKVICTSLCHTDITIWRMKRGGSRERGGRGRHGGAGVPGAVRRLPLPPQQHLLHAPAAHDPRHAARRHHALHARRHRRARPPLPLRLQLRRVHRRRRRARRQGRPRRPAGDGVPPQLRRVHGGWCGLESRGGGSRINRGGLWIRHRWVSGGAKMCGAKRIIGVDLNPDKFDIGKRLGITDFVNPNDTGEKPVSEVIKEMTGGGADYCFECIGSAPVMEEAFRSSRTGWGKTVILGTDGKAEPVSISSSEIKRGRSVHGALLGGIKPKDDIPVLAQKYLDKELQLDEFVTHETGFDEINGAFDLLVQGKRLRCIIWMDGRRRRP